MRTTLAALLLSIFGVALIGFSQPVPQTVTSVALRQPDFTNVNCAGFVSDQKVSEDIRLISGEQSNSKVTFASPDYVYINRGSEQGVKVGDRFFVVRSVSDPSAQEWFHGQYGLMRAIGKLYFDAGQVRVVDVHAKVSTAEISFSCGGFMQRGDVVRPYEDRPAPPFKDPAPFNHFAPVSGKPVGMVVTGGEFTSNFGTGDRAYVNLGSKQTLKVGDYVRFFRYQGERKEFAYIEPNYQYELYGFGSNPKQYTWKDLPREVLGEGIVLNVSNNASTVLVTFSTTPLYAGDYAEIE